MVRQTPPLFYWPRGSKYTIFKSSGSKNHTTTGFWDQSAYCQSWVLGPSKLGGLDPLKVPQDCVWCHSAPKVVLPRYLLILHSEELTWNLKGPQVKRTRVYRELLSRFCEFSGGLYFMKALEYGRTSETLFG